MQKRWLATSPGVTFDYLEEATQIDPFPAGAAIDRVVAFVASPIDIPRRDPRIALLVVAIAAVIGVSIGIVVGTGASLASSAPPAAIAVVTGTPASAGVTQPDDVSLARPQLRESHAVSMRLAEPVARPKRAIKPVKRAAAAKRRPIRVDASTALGTLRVK